MQISRKGRKCFRMGGGRIVMEKRWVNKWYELILAVLFLILLGTSWQAGKLEQDDYLGYAYKLSQGEIELISVPESRLFPALPVFLSWGLVVGLNKVGVVLIWVGVIYGMTMMLAKRVWDQGDGWIYIWFPPIVIKQLSLISTEGLLIVVMLGIYWAWKEKRFGVLGWLLGLAWWVRAIGIAFVVATGLVLVLRKMWDQLAQVLVGLGFMLGFWWGYNWLVLGTSDPFWQLRVYQDVGRSSLALVQLVADMVRAFDWGWQRHVYASMGYVAVLGWWLKLVWDNRGERKEDEEMFLVWAVVLMLGFVFSWGPTPFLEEFPRFLVPVFVYLGLLVNPVKCWRQWLKNILVLVSVLVVLA